MQTKILHHILVSIAYLIKQVSDVRKTRKSRRRIPANLENPSVWIVKGFRNKTDYKKANQSIRIDYDLLLCNLNLNSMNCLSHMEL